MLDGVPDIRVGVTVSSRVGKSVVRNRLKRWIRESLRRRKEKLPRAWSVLVAKTRAASATHAEIEIDVERVLARGQRTQG
jgi:ribonuclease P protein component